MKLRKLVLCTLAALMVSGLFCSNSYAAESSESADDVIKIGFTEEESYSEADVRLLSCLIYAEAGGEPYAGKLAVGIVINNRVRSSKFPDTLRKVVYQKSQFGPVNNGSLDRALRAYDRGSFQSSQEKACIEAAKESLSGTQEVTYRDKTHQMNSFLYFSGYVSNARLTIGNHQFK